jgi:hypothetical protein
MSVDRKRSWWIGLTWSAFALLLFASGGLLLLGCGINILPGHRYCPIPVDRSNLEREIATREALQQKIHDAEIHLARIAPCADPPAPQRRAQTGPIVGKSGRMQVTLWWHSTDDIDLYLECNPPGKEMSPQNAATRGPGLCGDGILDVDANRNMASPTTSPAEHIYWKENIPAASYTVKVRPFKTNSGAKIPYSVRVEFDGEEKICSGDVAWDGSSRTGHAQIAIVFRPSHPLPDCALEVQAMRIPCPPGQQCGGDKI